MADTLVIDPSGDNIIVPCQRAGKASKRRVGEISTSYSGARSSHIREELEVIPIVFVNATPAQCRAIEAKFALGAQVECAGTVFNREDAGTTVVVCDGEYTDDMEQGGGWRVPGITLYEVSSAGVGMGGFGAGSGGGIGGFPASVDPGDPVSSAGLVNWYDAQALVGFTDGDPLTLWPDESGNGNDASAGNPTFPGYYRTNVMNGHPAIRFDFLGNNQRGYSAFYAPTEGEAFIVLRRDIAWPADGAFWGFGQTATPSHIPVTSGGTMRDQFGSTVSRSFVIGTDPTVPFLYHVRAREGHWRCWVNGVLKYSSSSNTTLWSVPAWGEFLTGGAFYAAYLGWIGELKLYSGFLDDADAVAEEAALMTKWGIA